MGGGEMRIDLDMLRMAFGAYGERILEEFEQHAYLDLSNGEVIWFHDTDEDAAAVGGPTSVEGNREKRAWVRAVPERYLLLGEFSEEANKNMLNEFKMLKREGKVTRWEVYWEEKVESLIEGFLRVNGIEIIKRDGHNLICKKSS